MCRMNNLSRRIFALPPGTVILLVLCLGVLSSHILADSLHPIMWESQGCATHPDQDPLDQQDELVPRLNAEPGVADKFDRPSALEDPPFRHSFILSPLLPPPNS